MAHYASQSSPDSPTAGNPAIRLLITAGPTHEPIDAVRYLANRSSGRLGIALAEEAAERGLRVTLLLGPTHLDPEAHSHLKVARFRTTTDLQALLREHWPANDVLIMAAAVADYRPVGQRSEVGGQKSEVGGQRSEVSGQKSEFGGQKSEVSGQPLAASRDHSEKIKRSDHPLILELEPTPDLLAEVAATSRPDQRRIGFALEPADPPSRLLDSARTKLACKHLHAIVANPLETMDADSMPGGATIIFHDGREIAIDATTKREFARRLLDCVL